MSYVHMHVHACMSMQDVWGSLVSSPDPTLSQGETVWWTKSNFLD